MSNREMFDRFVTGGSILLKRSAQFDRTPRGMPPDFDWDKVDGMMLGLAIGDSLGNTSEVSLPEVRSRTFGTIRDYLPNRHVKDAATSATGRPKGYPTGDTQLAFWTLEQTLEDNGLDPAKGEVRGQF
jgi:ADP-ribosyl-[dinitrogen reductase] hydrolase